MCIVTIVVMQQSTHGTILSFWVIDLILIFARVFDTHSFKPVDTSEEPTVCVANIYIKY